MRHQSASPSCVAATRRRFRRRSPYRCHTAPAPSRALPLSRDPFSLPISVPLLVALSIKGSTLCYSGQCVFDLRRVHTYCFVLFWPGWFHFRYFHFAMFMNASAASLHRSYLFLVVCLCISQFDRSLLEIAP